MYTFALPLVRWVQPASSQTIEWPSDYTNLIDTPLHSQARSSPDHRNPLLSCSFARPRRNQRHPTFQTHPPFRLPTLPPLHPHRPKLRLTLRLQSFSKILPRHARPSKQRRSQHPPREPCSNVRSQSLVQPNNCRWC